MVWHDHSTIANHGHLVFLVCTLYDPAIHLTNKEFHNLTGLSVDVQTEIEKPDVALMLSN